MDLNLSKTHNDGTNRWRTSWFNCGITTLGLEAGAHIPF
jgi:hypothetical protein